MYPTDVLALPGNRGESGAGPENAPVSENGTRRGKSGHTADVEGWTEANTVGPEALARELTSATGNDSPIVVYTGSAFLFKNGHIPGAACSNPYLSRRSTDTEPRSGATRAAPAFRNRAAL